MAASRTTLEPATPRTAPPPPPVQAQVQAPPNPRCSPMAQRTLEWLRGLQPHELAKLGGPAIQSLGIPDVLGHLKLTSQELGEKLRPCLETPTAIAFLEKLVAVTILKADRVALGSVLARRVAVDWWLTQ